MAKLDYTWYSLWDMFDNEYHLFRCFLLDEAKAVAQYETNRHKASLTLRNSDGTSIIDTFNPEQKSTS